MKLASKMFALTALAVACSAASAQQTAPLTVTGNITPAACTASLSNDGAFKYADIDSSTLNDTSTTTLPTSPAASFNISCMGEAQVTWAIVDNQPGTSSDTSDVANLGLGTDRDGNKIGSYKVAMSSPVVDGVSNQVYVMKSTNGGVSWSYLERGGYLMRPAQLYTYSTDNGYNPGKGKTFSANVVITPKIAPKSTLNTTGDIELQGNATINLGYL
jgi:hypothetical protein